MERAIEVGGNYREWRFLALLVTSFVLLAGGAMLCATDHEVGLGVLVTGTLCGVGAGMAAATIARHRFSVQITPDGFIVRDRRGEREFTDEKVICASLSSTSNYSSGELKSSTRVFDVWVEGESRPERWKITNQLPLGGTDPLELLIERIIGHLYDRAELALASGQPFDGEGWSLHDSELVVGNGREAEAVRLSELAAVDVFDNDVCVWRHDREEPAVRVPVQSANAVVLYRLLRNRVPEPADAPAISAGDQLGRVLFERRPSRGLRLAVFGMPLVALGIVIVGIVASIAARQIEPILIGGCLSLAIGVFWLIPLSQCVRLRCHEHGVSRRWLRWEKRLPYAAVDSFAYSAVRQYVKGVYSGTTFTLTFVAYRNGRPVKLTYARTLRNADQELDHLRDHVSRVLAARMAERFGRGSPVSWTDGLRFLSDGLEYRAAGLLGRKSPIFVRYEQIAGIDVADGLFRLWVAGQKKPIMKEQVSQPNFFPGYVFLTRLLASQTQAQPVETVGRA